MNETLTQNEQQVLVWLNKFGLKDPDPTQDELIEQRIKQDLLLTDEEFNDIRASLAEKKLLSPFLYIFVSSKGRSEARKIEMAHLFPRSEHSRRERVSVYDTNAVANTRDVKNHK